MSSSYFKTLKRKVIDKSKGNNWEDAVKEWEIIDCDEDESCSEICICEKEGLRYLYTIQNKFNNNILFPIGSSCIKRFERDDLKEETDIYEQMFKLLHMVKDYKFINFTSELFSRKLLKYLYDDGAFDTRYNNYHGYDDYKFMVKMFNTRDKSTITPRQDKKIKAIIVNSIRPYLVNRLYGKKKKKVILFSNSELK